MRPGELRVEVNVDLWENLLSKLSESGLTSLEMAIVAERLRRLGGKA